MKHTTIRHNPTAPVISKKARPPPGTIATTSMYYTVYGHIKILPIRHRVPGYFVGAGLYPGPLSCKAFPNGRAQRPVHSRHWKHKSELGVKIYSKIHKVSN